MTQLTCAAAHSRLQAFHDDELPVGEQIAVRAHVETCEGCADALAELRSIQSVLTFLAPGRQALTNEELGAFGATVVGRLTAEEDASFLSRVRDVFDDMHFVYAGLGAVAATVVCVVIMLSMMRFATRERPDSLAAIMALVSTPIECETGNDLTDTSGCRARWEARLQSANESAEQDSVFELDAVVTHGSGRLANLAMLRAGRRTSADQAVAIEELLDSVCRSRLEGTPSPHPPVSVSMLWLVERATVRAAKDKDLPIEPLVPKKRAEGHQPPAPSIRA
jgi:hypothetical protein